MTRRILILTALALLLSSVAAHAAPLAARGEHDIGGLLEKAEELHDLSVVDAVYLLESRDVVIENGDRTSTTHRIVWIGTELGIELFADLRVPYNTANAELEVHTLRTWRDGVWWPHETEIAETAVGLDLAVDPAGALHLVYVRNQNTDALPSGIRAVLVAGEPVIQDGQLRAGARHGRVLRR